MYRTVDFLHKGIDGAWKRNSAIASNIANHNTPGYKRVEVSFQGALRNELDILSLRTTHEKHYKDVRHLYNGEFQEYGTKYRVDGNNVDLNVEEAELAKNSIYYQILVDEVNSQLQRLKTAMRIGK
ncbi:MAG: flagellar basal body rod protein FlgB [Bacillota bacterium]|nr:flagellar basal body rod protein FlgB [Bacillota bacterium]